MVGRLDYLTIEMVRLLRCCGALANPDLESLVCKSNTHTLEQTIEFGSKAL
jgi:hypothetical protein